MRRSLWMNILAVLMLIAMAFLISSPALAEVKPLPLDQTVPGNPAKAEGWIGNEEYEDESIHVWTEHTKVGKCPISIVHVTVADPSQIRTAMSEDNYDKTSYVKATALSKKANAIAAVNGDFFKYYDYGYLVRQGVKYREAYSDKHPRDVLIIDDRGDFWGVANSTAEKMADFMTNVLPADRTAVNTFSLGPLLVVDGEVQEITTRDFQYRYDMQRVGIVQPEAGKLEYVIIEVDGKADASYGMSIPRFAEYIHELYPDAHLAYNLDGGGSTNLLVNHKRIHKNPDLRNICDILYFASAAE